MFKLDTCDVILIPMGTVTAYLLKAESGCILIDAGNKNRIDRLDGILKQHGLQMNDIKVVVVTHAHYDHVGSLREIVEQSGAKTLVHVAESEYLAKGFSPSPRGTKPYSRLIVSMTSSRYKDKAQVAPVSPDILVTETYELYDYGIDAKVIPTPGHTAGSVTVIVENKIALAGDSIFNMFGAVFPPFANDVEALLSSWEVLLDTDCHSFCPGHGRPLSRARLERTLEKMRRGRNL